MLAQKIKLAENTGACYACTKFYKLSPWLISLVINSMVSASRGTFGGAILSFSLYKCFCQPLGVASLSIIFYIFAFFLILQAANKDWKPINQDSLLTKYNYRKHAQYMWIRISNSSHLAHGNKLAPCQQKTTSL